MNWFAVINKSTGRLMSTGTRVGKNLPATLEVRALSKKPSDDEMWDEGTRTFVARPAPTIIDRVDDIMNDPSLLPMSAAQIAAMRDVVGRVLGLARFRDQNEKVEFGMEPGF